MIRYSSDLYLTCIGIFVLSLGVIGSIAILLNPLNLVGSVFYIFFGIIILFIYSKRFQRAIAVLIPASVYEMIFKRYDVMIRLDCLMKCKLL